MRLPVRPTVRLRLTLLYGVLFLVTGALLLLVNYSFVRARLPAGPVDFEVGLVAPAPDHPGTEIVPAPGHDMFAPFPPDSPEGKRLQDDLAQASRAFRDATLHQLVVQSVTALGVMAVVSIGMGWIVAGRVLRPLHRISSTAQHLSEANLHERIALDGPDDELKQLADTFDAMLARLDAAFESQRRFIANASHELRTPLAIQRTLVEVALSNPAGGAAELAAVGDELRAAVDRSERLIDALLVLARSDRGIEQAAPVDLVAVAERAVANVAHDATAATVRIEWSPPPAPVVVEGEPSLLERVVVNLVDNGVRYNRPDGWVQVALRLDGDMAVLLVSSSGAVVEPEVVPALFEPFRRAAPDRTDSERGAGLGLSIVRSVVDAHRGQVSAAPLPAGGLEVTVRLPVRASHRGAGKS